MKMDNHLRNYVRNLILESYSVVIPPPPENTIEELNFVIDQYYNRYNPENVQELCDNAMEKLFNQIIKMSGFGCAERKIIGLKDSKVHDLIDTLKKHFRRDRPYHYAQKLHIGWRGDGHEMDTDNSFSYPSGHACQAYYIAHCLSGDYPEIRNDLFQVAEMVAQSRIDRGVHFPSDCEAGKMLAQYMYEKQK